ncbi:MAG: hypothetical protein LBD08_01835 [Treponema sp.]|jgi:hypothetical protein|nr:hypothetical protein [Treponema sp.]
MKRKAVVLLVLTAGIAGFIFAGGKPEAGVPPVQDTPPPVQEKVSPPAPVVVEKEKVLNLQPLTRENLNSIGREHIESLQYYLSAPLRLEMETTATTGTAKQGAAKVTSTLKRETVLFEARTMGVVASSSDRGGGKLFLSLCFEEDKSLVLSFLQTTDGFFDFYYSDQDVMPYGEQNYIVHYTEGIAPRLLINFESVQEIQVNQRKAKGRTIQN